MMGSALHYHNTSFLKGRTELKVTVVDTPESSPALYIVGMTSRSRAVLHVTNNSGPSCQRTICPRGKHV
jgi:hypothetical protein